MIYRGQAVLIYEPRHDAYAIGSYLVAKLRFGHDGEVRNPSNFFYWCRGGDRRSDCSPLHGGVCQLDGSHPKEHDAQEKKQGDRTGRGLKFTVLLDMSSMLLPLQEEHTPKASMSERSLSSRARQLVGFCVQADLAVRRLPTASGVNREVVQLIEL